MMTYKCLLVTHRGGIDAVTIVEKELVAPTAGQVRIKILASPVCQDDIAVRIGNRPFLAKTPFVPGYSMLGVVDAVGEGVNEYSPGECVAALTNFGGHAEYIYLPENELVKVPDHLDPAEAVVMMLNYLVAYQVMHRVVNVQAGQKALVVGASGGVGTAFLDLGRLAGLHLYGLASAGKFTVLESFGAAPIDYRTQDFVEVIRSALPDGLDFVFNGMGEEYFGRGLAVLRRGGVLVHYGGPQNFSRFLLLALKLIGNNLVPNGKKIKGYGTHRGDVDQYKKDWTELFGLLADRKIQPLIYRKLPLLEAIQAYKLLESGEVSGNIVLLSPELL